MEIVYTTQFKERAIIYIRDTLSLKVYTKDNFEELFKNNS